MIQFFESQILSRNFAKMYLAIPIFFQEATRFLCFGQKVLQILKKIAKYKCQNLESSPRIFSAL